MTPLTEERNQEQEQAPRPARRLVCFWCQTDDGGEVPLESVEGGAYYRCAECGSEWLPGDAAPPSFGVTTADGERQVTTEGARWALGADIAYKRSLIPPGSSSSGSGRRREREKRRRMPHEDERYDG